MTARADFDVGPLSWVKGEIDHAIQRSQEALRAFATDSADAAQLKSSQSHLHQAHGALSIVGLEGITRVSEELEGLLAGVEKDASLRKSEIFRLVERALWWVSLAFFDALAHKALPQDVDAKQLCNRIEHQIKRLLEGTPSVAERLMREVLYYVARAKPATARVREVQEAYHLSQTIPASESDDDTVEENPALKSAREHLNHAKDAWNKFASGNPPSLLAFRDSAAGLKADADQLGNADLAALAREVAEIAAWPTATRESMSEVVALEVATALLLLENALAGLAHLSNEFAQQAQLLRSRLEDCMLGKLRRSAPEIPLLDEMSRKAQERLLMNQVVSEMRANLRTIEQVLDTFFRDPAKRDELVSLDKPVHQLRGALDMLGEQRARESLGAAAEEIRRFSGAAHSANPQDFERIAQTLSGLGFYIEGLAHGKVDFETAMQPIAAASKEQADAAQPVATVEAQVAEQQRETASLYEEWKTKPEDGVPRAARKKNP